MARKIVVGNWKMHTLPEDAAALAEELRRSKAEADVTVVVCPPFTSLHSVRPVLNHSHIRLGAQNCSHESSGAFTGEVSVQMLNALGCSYVIVGHSERRHNQLESDTLVGYKAAAASEGGLVPIVCIGETHDQRSAGVTADILRSQLDGIVRACSQERFVQCIVAYEPVWAIGTGVSATAGQIEEAHTLIHAHLISTLSVDLPVLYGGSVNDTNAPTILRVPGVDGALVGGASLKAEQFSTIVSVAGQV